MNGEPINKRIILALDVNTVDEAKNIVNKLKDKIKFYKVGLQLFLIGGIDFLKWLKDQDVDIMLDLKFFDIPRTIDAAINQVQEYARFLTVHSQCNILSKISEEYRNKILGVIVLICFNDSDMEDDSTYISKNTGLPTFMEGPSIDERVVIRTVQSYNNNCAGVVTSGLEVGKLKNIFKVNNWYEYDKQFVFVVPGIQLEQKRQDDQKRVTTIEDAFENGADYVVIGRSILQSKDMIKTVELAQEKISKCGIRFGIATDLPYIIHKYPEGEINN